MKKPEYCTNEIFNFLNELEKSRKLFSEFSTFPDKLKNKFNLSIEKSYVCFSYWFFINKNTYVNKNSRD